MTTTGRTIDPAHPVSAALAHVGAELAGTRLVSMWSMGPADCREALLAMTRVKAQLADLEARVLVQAQEAGAHEASGATSTAAWWAHTTRATRQEAFASMRLATLLAAHPFTHDALAGGRLLVEQAQVICRAIEALPDDTVDAALRDTCERHLVELAADHDAKALRVLGRKVLAVVDPEAADAHEAKLLADEEARADAATRLTVRDDGQGQVHGAFVIPVRHGDMLTKILRALAAPKHQRANGGTYDHEKPTPATLGQAFCEFIERYPRSSMPHAGGVSAAVTITLPFESLKGGLEPGVLDTGTLVSASVVRRMMCEAGLIPAVLGGASQVLDLGRTRRLHTEAQRHAVALVQRHCQHPTCDVPAAMCHVHHGVAWVDGGPTDVAHAQLLCPRHHTLAHQDDPPPRPE